MNFCTNNKNLFGSIFFRAGTAIFLLYLMVFLLGIGNLWAEEEKPAGSFEDYQLRDWLLQDAGTDLSMIFAGDTSVGEAELISSVMKKIEKEAADRGEDLPADAVNEVARIKTEAARLAESNIPGKDPKWKSLYTDACRLRRSLRLAPVAAEKPEWIYTKHCVLGGSHYAYTENVTDAQFHEGMYEPGAALCRAVIAEDGTVTGETLMETETGLIRDPEVSWDGKKILFAKRDNFETDDYHLYDYEVAAGKVRQITKGLGFSDLEPAYMPDGSIMFISTRCMQTTDCWWTDVSNMYLCDPDGRYMRRISYDQVTINHPAVGEDGRVLYTRWDYNDRGQIFPQGLFSMNPDGTNQTAVYGNNSWFPTAILHARMIPNSSGKIVAVSGGHHSRQKGHLIIIDRANGTEENLGCHYIAPIRPADPERIDMIDQDGEQFQYPYPLDERNFLVAMRPVVPSGNVPAVGDVRFPNNFGLFWIDPDGNREVLVWDEKFSCGQEVPLGERELPIQRPSSVDYHCSTGQFYVQDVYTGPGLEGIERGTIKKLRVVALEFRAAGAYENWNTGRSGFSQCTTPIGCDNASWDVKRVLGEVPVEEDGSAYFEVPARTPVYFQLLDEKGDTVQTMRSWSTLQPNEFFGCVGCHEPKDSTINNVETLTTGNQTLALRKGVMKPEPLFEPDSENPARGVSYERDIQPIFDRYCISCHIDSPTYPSEQQARDLKEKEDPGYKNVFSLTSKPAITNPTIHPYFEQYGRPVEHQRNGRVFYESYNNLTENGKFEHYINPINVQDAPPMLPPYYRGSAKSPLMAMLRNPSGVHRDVHVDDLSLRRLAAWIDLIVPYCGSYTEAADWAISKEAEYYYNLTKRKAMEELEARNIQQMLDVREGKGAAPALDEIEHIGDYGREVRKDFIRRYIESKR